MKKKIKRLTNYGLLQKAIDEGHKFADIVKQKNGDNYSIAGLFNGPHDDSHKIHGKGKLYSCTEALIIFETV